VAAQDADTPRWPRSLGLVGAGAMGRAMAAGLVGGLPHLGAATVVADAITEAAEAGAAELGGRVGSVAEAASADLVVVAVKPKDAAAALEALAPAVGDQGVLLSVMAGWDLERLRSHVPSGGLARTMPNLAVRMGAGIVAVATADVPAGRTRDLLDALEHLGEVVELPESLFPAATALAGMFPPYVRDGHRMVDGLALEPVPTAAVVEDGADVTVSVNLMGRETLPSWPGHDGPPPKPPRGRRGSRMLDTLLEVMDLMQLDTSTRGAELADVPVTPLFGPGSWRDFHLADLFLEAGRAAAREQLPALQALARPRPAGVPT